MKSVTKIPSLKIVTDQEASAKLVELIKDADDGLRRVVRCGLYIEWIAANLPHGQFLPWLETNCPTINERVTYRWRTLAKNICEWSGLKFDNLSNLTGNTVMLLDCPVEELPKSIQAARKKIDDLLDSAKTPKQLFLDMGFKQGELDDAGYARKKAGRRKGEGGASAEQRAKVALAVEKEQDNVITLKVIEITEWLNQFSDDKGLGRLAGTPELAALDKAMDYARGYIRHQL